MHTSPPGAEVRRNLLLALYHVHPVRNEICGTRESISQITPELLYACADAFYRPSNMSLVIAGDVDPETVRNICDEMLPPDPNPAAVRIEADEPETVRDARIEKEREVAQPLICIGFKSSVPSPSEELLVNTANAINMQLLFGRSGDFFNRLSERGVISEQFGADFAAEFGYAFTKIFAACDDPDLFLEEVKSEIDRRLSVYYTAEEFETAKRVIYVDSIFGLDSVEETALSCSDCWIHGYDHLQWLQALMRITPEEAFDVLRKTVIPDRCSVSIVYPQKNAPSPN